MHLTVIGCSGSFPTPASAASCYLVEHDGTRLVLDLGSGALGPLAAVTNLRAIDAILLSHLHPDHCLDLTGLHVALNYDPVGPPSRPIPVHGPTGTARRIADAYRADGTDPSSSLARAFDFVDHTETLDVGPFSIRLAEVAHPVRAYAIRVEAQGRSLVFSGDTGPTPALVDLARNADLALFEASFLDDPDNPPNLHLAAREAAEHATAAGVDRLVLTHLVTWNDPALTLAQAGEAFSGDLSVAKPGLVVEV